MVVDTDQLPKQPNDKPSTIIPIYSDPTAKSKITKIRKVGAICTFIYAIDLVFALVWIIALAVVVSNNLDNGKIAATIISSPTWAVFSVFVTLFSFATIAAFIMNCVMIFTVDAIKTCCLDPVIRSEWTSVFVYLIVALFITLIFNIIAQVKIRKLALLTVLQNPGSPTTLLI